MTKWIVSDIPPIETPGSPDSMESVVSKLQRYGWSPEASAGVAGNLFHESKLNPNQWEIGGSGYGLAQWTGPRRKALSDYATQKGKPADDIDLQIEFLNHELMTSHNHAADALRNTKSPEHAARIFNKHYEIPGVAATGSRVAAAKKAYGLIDKVMGILGPGEAEAAQGDWIVSDVSPKTAIQGKWVVSDAPPQGKAQPAPAEITPETVMAGAPEAAIVKEKLPDMKKFGPWSREAIMNTISRWAGAYEPASAMTGAGVMPEPESPVWQAPPDRKTRMEVAAKALEPVFMPEGKVPAEGHEELVLKGLVQAAPVLVELMGYAPYAAPLAGTAAAPAVPFAILGATEAEPGKGILKGAALGGSLGLMHKLAGGLKEPVAQWITRITGGASIGGGAVAIEGGTPEDIAQNAALFAMFEAFGMPRKQLKDMGLKPEDISAVEKAIETGDATPEAIEAIKKVSTGWGPRLEFAPGGRFAPKEPPSTEIYEPFGREGRESPPGRPISSAEFRPVAPITPTPTPEPPVKPPEPSVAAREGEAGDYLADETGKPMVVYRGESSGEIKPFDKTLTREKGFFFTPDQEIAQIYAGKTRKPSAFYIKADKVIDLTKETPEAEKFIREWAKAWEDEGWIDRTTGEPVDPVEYVRSGQLFDYEGNWSGKRWKDVQATAEEEGYDAIILPDYDSAKGVFPSVVAFKPEQIEKVKEAPLPAEAPAMAGVKEPWEMIPNTREAKIRTYGTVEVSGQIAYKIGRGDTKATNAARKAGYTPVGGGTHYEYWTRGEPKKFRNVSEAMPLATEFSIEPAKDGVRWRLYNNRGEIFSSVRETPDVEAARAEMLRQGKRERKLTPIPTEAPSDLVAKGKEVLGIPQLTDREAVSPKGTLDSISLDLQNIRDLSKTKTFKEQGLGGFDEPTRDTVMRTMLTALHNPEIRDAVTTVPIDVVDNLINIKSPPKIFLHDKAVNPEPFVLNRDASISVRIDIADSAAKSMAIPIAKMSAVSPEMDRELPDKTTAEITRDIGHEIPPISVDVSTIQEGIEKSKDIKKLYSGGPDIETIVNAGKFAYDYANRKTPGLDIVRNVKRGIQSLVLPTAKSPEHLKAAETLGAELGTMYRRTKGAEHIIRGYRRTFDKMGIFNVDIPLEQNPGIKFASDVMQGRKMEPKLQKMADDVRRLFDQGLKDLEAAGVPIEQPRENYFPNIVTRESRRAVNQSIREFIQERGWGEEEIPNLNEWSLADKVAVKARAQELRKAGEGSDIDAFSFLSKRPFKGKEAFRKPKVFDDIMTAVEFGYEPASPNPFDLVALKLAEINRSAMANRAINNWTSKGDIINVNNSGNPLKKELREGFNIDEWGKIDDKYGTIWHRNPETHLLEKIGNRVAKKPVADILNNYLSSSLYNNPHFGQAYKGFMGTGNLLNQFQLGLGSLFHGGFTSIDTQLSAGAEVIKDVYGLFRGNRTAAQVGDTLQKYPMAMVRTGLKGAEYLSEWNSPSMDTPTNVPAHQLDQTVEGRTATIAKAAELAGMKWEMERGLRTHQSEQLIRNWYGGAKGKAVLRSPVALSEASMIPVMNFLVPRQKFGVFGELVGRILEQNPGKTLEELTPAFRQAGNRTDARLGQVGYDRLFINNTAKNVIQVLMRAPGWAGGTLSEIGGSVKDAGKFIAEWYETGKAPQDIPDRVAYTLSLLGTMALANGLLTYLFTGEKPTGMDYWAFRSGGVDDKGRPNRWLMPSYAKEIYSWFTKPQETAFAKLHPLLGLMSDIWRNRTFYGDMIRTEDASYGRQVLESGEYTLKAFEPFWTRGVRKAAEREGEGIFESPQKIAAPLVGVMPAPRKYTGTEATEIMDRYYELQGHKVKTPEEAKVAELKSKAIIAGRKGELEKMDKIVSQLEQKHKLTDKQVDSLYEKADTPHFAYGLKQIKDFDVALRIWDKANPEQKSLAASVMAKKLSNLEKNNPDKYDEIEPRLDALWDEIFDAEERADAQIFLNKAKPRGGAREARP